MSYTLETTPVRFECYDPVMQEEIFVVEAFDEFCSTVKVKVVVTPDNWPAISKEIHKALKKIHPKPRKIDIEL